MMKILFFIGALGGCLCIKAQYHTPPNLYHREREPLQIIADGEITSLKGIKLINIRYDYTNVWVLNTSEEQYLTETAAEYEQKEPGRGERFKETWFKNRQTKYEPKFELLFNKYSTKIKGQNYANINPVTLVIKTVKITPNQSQDFTIQYLNITLRAIFVDKDNQEIFSYNIENIEGRTYAECYAQAAKILAKDLTKKLRKIK